MSTLNRVLDEEFRGVKRIDAMKRSWYDDRAMKSQSNIMSDFTKYSA